MSHIWNVSSHVGDAQSCQNTASDVNLVKILLAEWIRFVNPSIHQSCREVFLINGQMDINTAYWIRVMNTNHASHLSFVDAGIISPAQGSSYGNDTWSIVRLNNAMNHSNHAGWLDLPNHSHATPDLRAALGRTTP